MKFKTKHRHCRIYSGNPVWITRTSRVMTIFVGILIISTPTLAQEKSPLCRMLKNHKPAPGVSYQPGVDVHGKPVVSADLNGSLLAVPEVVKVPLSVDVAQRLENLGTSKKGVLGETELGVLEIHQDGRVVYQGQDWTEDIHSVCGQPAPDVIKSKAAPSEELIEGGDYHEEGYK